jgi:2-oxoglutarate ferredoxin oxidoreductase subunit gamma
MARAEVIISDEPVTDPQVRRPDVLMALAQDAINRHLKKIKPGGLLVMDSDLVQEVEKGNFEVLSIPATSIADKEMGSVVVANLILLGGLLKKTAVLSVGAMEKAIEGNVPPKAKEMNLKAFRRGLEF